MFYNDDKEKVEVSLVGKIIYDKKNGIYKDMFEKQQLEASIGEQEVAIR